MLRSAMLYCVFQLAALAGVSVMSAVRRQLVVFCRAGAICWLLRPPNPHSANPTFFREVAARARVTLVLMNGAAATAAACAMNVRRGGKSGGVPSRAATGFW